ncbi:MAG: type II toxin-antitoxin system RelE/ParE family toxin [Pirellulales bacterium]|nr:type II toxin-antitoxin system RelE/ParE family toxin [Pirellulales bacterium]
MIKSFKDSETEKVHRRLYAKRFPRAVQPAALRKLRMLNNAHSLTDLQSPPGNSLERLKGNRAGQHSIRINDQWRVCFRRHEGDAQEVEIVDYH